MKTLLKEKYKKSTATEWFNAGERLPYDPEKKRVIKSLNEQDVSKSVMVWNRVVNDYSNSYWMTMMPGFPDGSFGWAGTEQRLSETETMSQLYIDYIGMGDSDKPEDYPYSVVERADMIEAFWRHHGVKQTILVTFDFSSLVAMELLSRQIIRGQLGVEPPTVIDKVLFINGGLFADAHSHPFMTTPLLKTSMGRMGAKMAQKSPFVFNLMMKDLWSKEYGLTKEELAENFTAITRRNGALFMSNAAGFVDEHQINGNRWNLKRIFDATYPSVKYIVAGSEKDQFEYKQVIKAERELASSGLVIEKYPGGHMTTSEYPDLIVKSIERLKSI